MTHPKGPGFRPIFDPLPDGRLTRGGDEGSIACPPSDEPYPALAGPDSPFALPLLGEPVQLTHRMDCPRCLGLLLSDAPGAPRGTIEVTMGVHLHTVDTVGLDADEEGWPALGLTLSPRLTRAGPVLHCSAGCRLTAEEWEVVLGAAFLEACKGYVARIPGALREAPEGGKPTKRRRRP
jgi:hypothetical protein